MMEKDGGFRQRLDSVEGLVRALEECADPRARDAARELVRALLDLHAAGLTRVLDMTGTDGGPGLTDRLVGDPLVSSLLLLHGIHPAPVQTRVAEALKRLRPQLRTQGGDAELLLAGDDLVRIRLRGERGAGPELQALIESALMESAPDATAIEFESTWDGFPSTRVPLPVTRTGA
ncbi:MAG TPA: NifU family protein [Gemmataceae bacterium]|nr:NifU family protein [Gemmataceae bacterium]